MSNSYLYAIFDEPSDSISLNYVGPTYTWVIFRVGPNLFMVTPICLRIEQNSYPNTYDGGCGKKKNLL